MVVHRPATTVSQRLELDYSPLRASKRQTAQKRRYSTGPT